LDFNTFLTNDYEALTQAADKITGNNKLALDLLHYSILELSDKENLQAIIDSGGSRFYLVRIMMTQWRSRTGPFYKMFMKSHEQIEYHDTQETEEITLDINKINNILDGLTWYDRELFKAYSEGEHNYSTLAVETGIPRTSIGLTLNRIKTHIKKNL